MFLEKINLFGLINVSRSRVSKICISYRKSHPFDSCFPFPTVWRACIWLLVLLSKAALVSSLPFSLTSRMWLIHMARVQDHTSRGDITAVQPSSSWISDTSALKCHLGCATCHLVWTASIWGTLFLSGIQSNQILLKEIISLLPSLNI